MARYLVRIHVKHSKRWAKTCGVKASNPSEAVRKARKRYPRSEVLEVREEGTATPLRFVD